MILVWSFYVCYLYKTSLRFDCVDSLDIYDKLSNTLGETIPLTVINNTKLGMITVYIV